MFRSVEVKELRIRREAKSKFRHFDEDLDKDLLVTTSFVLTQNGVFTFTIHSPDVYSLNSPSSYLLHFFSLSILFLMAVELAVAVYCNLTIYTFWASVSALATTSSTGPTI
jgi:hypothetical protein